MVWYGYINEFSDITDEIVKVTYTLDYNGFQKNVTFCCFLLTNLFLFPGIVYKAKTYNSVSIVKCVVYIPPTRCLGYEYEHRAHSKSRVDADLMLKLKAHWSRSEFQQLLYLRVRRSTIPFWTLSAERWTLNTERTECWNWKPTEVILHAKCVQSRLAKNVQQWIHW